MTEPAGTAMRGEYREITIRPLPVRYSGNGLRSVPLEATLADIESFFLESGLEVQFQMFRRSSDESTRAILEYLSPEGEEDDEKYSGKGATEVQALVSACLEFVERQCSKLSKADVLTEASFREVASTARDPRSFNLAPNKGTDPGQVIDWVWGQSVTRSEPVLVPANLVFCPYQSDESDKFIAWTDSNGLASGNNLEEAILHGLLEVVERDAVVISEFNRLPQSGITLEDAPAEVAHLTGRLAGNGYRCSCRTAMTDLPIPAVSCFLQHEQDPDNCSVAFGCHLDPGLALMRAVTEAIQLLPPAVNHEAWVQSGSPRYYESTPPKTSAFRNLENLASGDLERNIETCVSMLAKVGAEVIVVDLSLPGIPFSAVRVLATGLQPLVHEDDRRLSKRFFEVPAVLGHRSAPTDPESVAFWPIVGYR